jgi:hypothetical protein
MGKDWINEALELTRKTEEREKDRERSFSSDELRAMVLGNASNARMPANLPGLAEALEIDRKLRRSGM